MRNILLMTGALSLVPTVSFAADCGDVSIADMNWSSASLMANVDKYILENGFGCDVDLIPGDTMPTGTSMLEKNEPDVAPEMWANASLAALQKGIDDKRLRFSVDSLSDGGEEGFWVPKYMVEKYPELATIEGVRKHPELFEHPEDDELGALYGCPAGWNCQISTVNLFQALKMEDAGFEVIDPGSAAGLSGSIARAYEREQGWLGYYWAPTAILGKYEMVKVDFGSGINKEHFVDCITQENCLDPKPTMYPPSFVTTVTTEDFATREPQAYDYFTKRAFTNKDMNKLLAWMEENQADGEIAAEYFIENHEALWSKWVPADVATKIKNSL
ncbi:ABC transporter substrate-binding protein [Marinomonas algicola]|uniref:ABC transporter substrate-binding protein n=1 Tax=Marinomonas algicola TaxID=2773454 RepID=UPI00174BFDC6|nr:ABC transporter substrate-binding protein [Marinomonas algicola]